MSSFQTFFFPLHQNTSCRWTIFLQTRRQSTQFEAQSLLISFDQSNLIIILTHHGSQECEIEPQRKVVALDSLIICTEINVNPSAAVLLLTGRGSVTCSCIFSSRCHIYSHSFPSLPSHLFDPSLRLALSLSPGRLRFSTLTHLFPSSNTIICSCEVASPSAAYKRRIDLSSFICGVLSLLHRLYCAVKGCEIFGLISHTLPFQNMLPIPSSIFGSMLLGQSVI